jgi:predicted transcriptional regulator
MPAIRLPEDIEARLENLAKRTGRSKTFYAREVFWPLHSRCRRNNHKVWMLEEARN